MYMSKHIKLLLKTERKRERESISIENST